MLPAPDISRLLMKSPLTYSTITRTMDEHYDPHQNRSGLRAPFTGADSRKGAYGDHRHDRKYHRLTSYLSNFLMRNTAIIEKPC